MLTEENRVQTTRILFEDNFLSDSVVLLKLTNIRTLHGLRFRIALFRLRYKWLYAPPHYSNQPKACPSIVIKELWTVSPFNPRET